MNFRPADWLFVTAGLAAIALRIAPNAHVPKPQPSAQRSTEATPGWQVIGSGLSNSPNAAWASGLRLSGYGLPQTPTTSSLTSHDNDTKLPDTPSGRRMAEFLAAYNTCDVAKIRKMLDFSFINLGSPKKAAQFAGDLAGVVAELGRVKVVEIVESKRTVLVVKIKCEKSTLDGLRLDTGLLPPNLAASVLFGRVVDLRDDVKPKTYDVWKDASDLLAQIVKDRKVPAMCLAAVQNGKLVAEAVAGVREIEKPDLARLSDRWLVGSVTKSMTATMIAALVERGKLRWDETLAQALPGVPMRSEYREVTLDQILHHRSGLVQDEVLNGIDVDRIVGKATNPTKIRRNYVLDILSRKPISAPGQRYAYSNAGYAVLGYVAERRMGRPYEQLMRDLVFRPLHMKSAIVGTPGAIGQPGGKGAPAGHYETATGLEPGRLDAAFCHMSAPAGLGVSCSIEDLAGFAEFHLEELLRANVSGPGYPDRGWVGLGGYGPNGLPEDAARIVGGVLKTSTVRYLHQPMKLADRPRYACGWSIRTDLVPEEAHWHNGSDGTFLAEMMVCPKNRVVIVAIQNSGTDATGDSPPTRQAILAMYRRLVKQP